MDFTDYSYEFKQIYNTGEYFEVIDKWGNKFNYPKDEYRYEIYGDIYLGTPIERPISYYTK